jgi:hypothetical protein
MSMKSPYGKRPAKATGTSKAKHSTPIGTSRGGTLTKQEKTQARLRAREWARNTLGRTKDASTPTRPLRGVDSLRMIVIDDDDDEEEEEEEEDSKWFVRGNAVARAANVETREKAHTKVNYDSLRERTSTLNIESGKTPETSTFVGLRSDESIGEEEVFYDALEDLPTRRDVAVEEVSDEEDDEICDLRSTRRNRAPSEGEQWMEPLEPVGISFSTFVAKADP